MFITVFVYFLVAAGNYTTSAKVGVAEIWVTWAIYFLFMALDAYLTYSFAMDSILYLLPDEVRDWCDKHPGVCDDLKLLDRKSGSGEETEETGDEFDF